MSFNCSLTSIKEAGPKGKGLSSFMLRKLAEEKEARFAPHPFKSVAELLATLNLPQSKFAQGWRLSEFVLGHVNAMPLSHGRMAATDGMLCIILQPKGDGSWGHYIGHVSAFVFAATKRTAKAKTRASWLDSLLR